MVESLKWAARIVIECTEADKHCALTEVSIPRRNTFRRITGSDLGWHPELGEGEGAERYSEWLWLDGQLEGGYQYSLGLFSTWPQGMEEYEDPEKSRWPTVALYVLTPEGKVHRGREVYPPESFKPEPFGGTWANNTFTGKLKPDGTPEGYDVKVSVGDVGVNLTARAVAIGLQFTDQERGYTYYHPFRNIALGWWPLVPRAEVEGTLTIEGRPVKVSGLGYVERQLTNMPGSFGGGSQAWWSWGHFYADDYTAVWTDSAASEHYRYRHFSPFALWKGSELILSTFQFTCYVEKFGIEPELGNIYPAVESLRASDGNVELTAQLLPGRISDCFKLGPGQQGVYTRQFCDVDIQLRRWDEVELARGTAVHEFGAGEHWFPFSRLK